MDTYGTVWDLGPEKGMYHQITSRTPEPPSPAVPSGGVTTLGTCPEIPAGWATNNLRQAFAMDFALLKLGQTDVYRWEL